MVKKFMFSSTSLKNNLQTYLQSFYKMNCLKFIEIILGYVRCNALLTTILYCMSLYVS
jgi:hypothetical protein